METDTLDIPTAEELLEELSRYGTNYEELQPGDICSKDIQRIMNVSRNLASETIHRMLDGGEWKQVYIKGSKAIYLRPVSERARKAAGL